MKKLLRYSLKSWLIPPLFLFVVGSVPLIVAIFVGLDGFTFMAMLVYGMIGCLIGFVVHAILAAFYGNEGTGR